MTGIVVPRGGQFLNTESGLSAPGGILDRLTQAMDGQTQFQGVLRGLGPALNASGVPVSVPGPSTLSRVLGAFGLGSTSSGAVPPVAPPPANGAPASPMSAPAGPSADGSAPTSASAAPAGMMGMFSNAIAGIESKGNYGALGPQTQSGDQALGKYQVMASNVGPWTKEILGQELTPAQFVASPQAQEAVFNGKFSQYLQKTGNPQDAASMWFTGQPLAQGAGAQDQLGTTGAGYVSRFMAALPGGGGTAASAPGGPAQATAYAPSGSGDMPRAPAVQALNGAAPMPIATASSATPHTPQPGSQPTDTAATGPAQGGGSASPSQILAPLMANPATRQIGGQLWQASRQQSGGMPGSMTLPAGMTPEALASMISTPQTQALGLQIWQKSLYPQISSIEPGRAIFRGTQYMGQAPSAPMDVAPGGTVLDPNSGRTIARTAPLPVKLSPGESLVPPLGGAPVASSPPNLNFTDVNGHVIGSNPQSGASTDVTPQSVPSTPDLKAAEGANTNILDKVSKSRDQAISASRTIDAINRQQTALDQGTFTGGGPDTKLKIMNAVAGMFGLQSPDVAHTQEFIAAANSKAAELAKQLSNSGHTTNADINMAKIMSGADPNYSLGALREIGRSQQQLALDTINRHNASLAQASQLIPALAQRQSFYKVPVPTNTYDFATTGALSRARAALAQGVPRNQVIQRLQAGGVDPGRL